MTDTPSDDRFSMPPIEGARNGHEADESADDSASVTSEAAVAPVLPPPGLFARLHTPSDEESGPEDLVADDMEPDDEPDHESDDGFDPVAAPLVGVADAIDIVEQLALQSSVADEEADDPSGDDLIFADAAEGIDEDEGDDDPASSRSASSDWGNEDGFELTLPSYALIRDAARDDENEVEDELQDEEEDELQEEDEAQDEAGSTASAALPMYGGDSPADEGEEILPHFLLEEAAPLDIVGAQEQLRELAQKNRRKAEVVEHKPSLARTLAEIPILLLVAAVIAFLVKTFLAQAYYIPSGSMLPQLRVDDRVVVSKLAYKLHDPRRGDIIVFDDPQQGVSDDTVVERTGVAKLLHKVGEGVGVVQPSTDEFIKRVIALPGETVAGKNGFVYVNDRKLIEPYLPNGLETSDFPAQKVAAGKLWVMGDNRGGSSDSRVFGQIDVDSIVGRAVVKVWPFSSLSFL